MLLLTLWLRQSAGAPALKYGDVITETTSPGEVKGLITKIKSFDHFIFSHIKCIQLFIL